MLHAANAHTLVGPDTADVHGAVRHVALATWHPYGDLHVCSGGIGFCHTRSLYCLLNDTESVENDAVFTQSFAFHVDLNLLYICS